MPRQNVFIALLVLTLLLSCGKNRPEEPTTTTIAATVSPYFEVTTGSPANDQFRDAILLPGGEWLVAGFTQMQGGAGDAWIVKLSAAGEVLRSFTLGGEGYDEAFSVVPCPDGGAAFCGVTTTASSNMDAWVVKLDKALSVVWQQTYGGAGSDSARSMIALPDGGFVFAGVTASQGAGSYDAWVVKLSPRGDLLEQAVYGGRSADSARAVIRAAGGDFYAAGASSLDFYVARLATNLRPVWLNVYPFTGVDEAQSLVETPAGNILVMGHAATGTAYDVRILELTPESGAIRDRIDGSQGNDWGKDVIIIESNNIFASSVEDSRSRRYDVNLFCETPDGTKLWDVFLGEPNSDEFVSSLTELPGKGFAVTGYRKTERGDYDGWFVVTNIAPRTDNTYWSD